MNILREYLISDANKAKYNLHIEDDWEWWFPDYFISKGLQVLTRNKSYGQALFNFEYTEDEYTAQDIWNRDMSSFVVPANAANAQIIANQQIRYFVHEYFTGERLKIEQNHLQGISSMYWPHFSFRVGLTKIEVYKKLGSFSETHPHFEMEYAHRYVAAGYVTSMLDCCYTTHIGRRTYERNDMTKLNAYDLNKEQQFGTAPKEIPADTEVNASNVDASGDPIKLKATSKVVREHEDKSYIPTDASTSYHDMTNVRTYVINLERRPERLVKFIKTNNGTVPPCNIWHGVDGSKLEPDLKIQKIFETGDYRFRKGIVGCAYSHLKIWADFARSSADFCVVLEDDVKLVPHYTTKLMSLLRAYSFDVLFLHWNPYNHVANKEEWEQVATTPIAEQWTVQQSMERNMGSGAGYVLTRKAVKHMLNFVKIHGMPNAVDWVLMKQSELKVYYSKPKLVLVDCWQNNTTIQSDIQQDYNSVSFPSPHHIVIAEINRWVNFLGQASVDYQDANLDKDNPMHQALAEMSKADSCIKVWMDNKKVKEMLCKKKWSKEHKTNVYFTPVSADFKPEDIPETLPVKWYMPNESWIVVVPDCHLTSSRYNAIVWGYNRLNFNSV